jgi:glutaredoxin
LDADPGFRQRVYDLGRRWTVPLVTIDGEPIGGYDELAALDRSGLLAERLAA